MRKSTTEARRHGGKSGSWALQEEELVRTYFSSAVSHQIAANVILSEPEQLRGRVEGSRDCVDRPGSVREFSRECLEAAWERLTESGSFDSARLTRAGLSCSRRSAQDDRSKTARSYSGIMERVRVMLAVIIGALREIFDENAYARFLERTHSSRSNASYQAFLREREALMVERPRCC